jgi:hypothetical protein
MYETNHCYQIRNILTLYRVSDGENNNPWSRKQYKVSKGKGDLLHSVHMTCVYGRDWELLQKRMVIHYGIPCCGSTDVHLNNACMRDHVFFFYVFIMLLPLNTAHSYNILVISNSSGQFAHPTKYLLPKNNICPSVSLVYFN